MNRLERVAKAIVDGLASGELVPDEPLLTEDSDVKPLSEWTAEQLKDELFGQHMYAGESLDELLRRARAAERERCAEECERIGGEYRYDYAESAYRAATVIRGLQ